MLALMRRAARAVSVARDERVRRGVAVPADGADGANCPKHPRRSYVHALRRNHRALRAARFRARESRYGRSRHPSGRMIAHDLDQKLLERTVDWPETGWFRLAGAAGRAGFLAAGRGRARRR